MQYPGSASNSFVYFEGVYDQLDGMAEISDCESYEHSADDMRVINLYTSAN